MLFPELTKRSSRKKNATRVAKNVRVADETASTIDQKRSAERLETRLKLIGLGLFDEIYYRQVYADLANADIDLYDHYMQYGYKEGRRPNPLFDGAWYLESNPDVRDAGAHPLAHYAFAGEREGRRPCPHFDPAWYRERYGLPDDVSALGHYLQHRVGPFSPIPEFDAEYYLETYPDIAAANVDPFEHYIHFGYREGRNPSKDFDTRFYIQRYLKGSLEQNPLVHYLERAHLGGYHTRAPEDEATIPSEVKRFTKAGAYFEERAPLDPKAPRKAKVLAYYLTQFHAFPENDQWWGTGFTEWTNIARGLPRFKDHYQPGVPRDLGFYNLNDIETMRRQVELAKSAGIHGFVFYYYWFNSKRLMEKPLEAFIAARDIDMPFCLMWANENWTRRWDGLESEVLISQNYLEGDDTALIDDWARHFADPRYIRVNGRPLLMIYRPRLIPNAREAIQRWRDLFRERCGEDPLLIMSQSFDDVDPRPFGLDGAIEFPPHKVTKDIRPINSNVTLLDDTFSGNVYSYDDVVSYSLREKTPHFPLIKTLVPSWDNDARRQGTGLVIQGSTPSKYEAWLSGLVRHAQANPFHGEPFVCVNAWNEWCEGAYLEPDLHFGSAYLNATARAVSGLSRDGATPQLLLVGHDAFPSGAQQLLLSIAKSLKSAHGVAVEFLLLGGGELERAYRDVAPVTTVFDAATLALKAKHFRERGFSTALCNTTASGQAVAALSDVGMRTVLLVHELPQILREKGLVETARAGIRAADDVVFPSASVRSSLLRALDLAPEPRFQVRPQGIYKTIERSDEERARIRNELGVQLGDRLVFGAGYADMRKGFDLFLQSWRLMQGARSRVHFCWAGGIDPVLASWLSGEIATATATGTFHMVGFRQDVGAFFSAADAFALTSREDPFPTVALEAMAAGVPVVAFDETGGIPDLMKSRGFGDVVPYCDVPAMSVALGRALNRPTASRLDDVREKVAEEFAFGPYVSHLLKVSMPSLASVSVVVPNYNYAKCLRDRLETIFDQTHPVHEIIVLDDASTDDSVDVIIEAAEKRERDLALVINDSNSGSVFAQWRKGAEMASGDYIWIAEADDLSHPTFIAALVGMMATDPSIDLAFSDSRAIDMEGKPIYDSYKPYYASIEPGALSRTEVFAGQEFVQRFLAVKNTILNVSSVIWRREALLKALDTCAQELSSYRMAGDWRIYLEVLAAKQAKIAYVADPLNVHRRHASSVTHALKAEQHLGEIDRTQRLAQRMFNLKDLTVQGQQAYLSEVSEQLLGPRPAHSTTGKRDNRRTLSQGATPSTDAVQIRRDDAEQVPSRHRRKI